MGRTLYLECASGISGDMFAASLLDLGADRDKLKKTLGSIQAEGAEIIISRVKKSGLDVCDFLVKLDEEHENHDHDMEYLHGRNYSHEDREMHNIEHGRDSQAVHHHGHSHDGQDMHHHEHSNSGQELHHHRGLPEILMLLKDSTMSERAYEYAEKIFRILAEAEAKAHGVPVDQVHFHEVGAIDSIMDIAAAAICLDDLDVEKVYIPELTEGSGTVRCQHGILPVPVPAVTNIAAAHSLPIRKTGVKGELITPTGAAIAAAIRTEDALPEKFVIEAVGLGAGKREYETPGFLRAMLIREERNCGSDGSAGVQETEPTAVADANDKSSGVKKDVICKLETDVDDCTGEILGALVERLLNAGARDVHYTPVYMKKNRPGVEITVLCEPEQAEAMEGILFRETTTIGIRRCLMERHILERTIIEKDTPWGVVRMKACRLPGEEKYREYVEYQEAEKLSERSGRSLPEIYEYLLKKQ
ncbi:MAG: nickel pincer cofactor biosynthesis protein LarC [Lachnospiraceae bacterium]|nr:nickel pincer cofactor biosynthesis protein LarC [Lachnospiraceae bacterium]